MRSWLLFPLSSRLAILKKVIQTWSISVHPLKDKVDWLDLFSDVVCPWTPLWAEAVASMDLLEFALGNHFVALFFVAFLHAVLPVVIFERDNKVSTCLHCTMDVIETCVRDVSFEEAARSNDDIEVLFQFLREVLNTVTQVHLVVLLVGVGQAQFCEHSLWWVHSGDVVEIPFEEKFADDAGACSRV